MPMSVTSASPDKNTFEILSRQIRIGESFVEKDWHVVQILARLAEVNLDGFEIIFSGGTALSKAHKLIKRFSEDVDFRVIAQPSAQGRKALSGFKNNVVESLRDAGLKIEDYQIKARDENRFFSIDLDYNTYFPRKEALRPHIQIEVTMRGLQLPPVYMPVSSFLNETAKHAPEVKRIGCIDPIENAADKLSALAWRIPDRVRGGQYDDPTIVRHIHDLAMLRDVAAQSNLFSKLVTVSMQHDDRRSKNNSAFSGLPIEEKFKQMLSVFDEDDLYRQEYEVFVKSVSYAPDGSVPDFDAAVDAARALAKIVAS